MTRKNTSRARELYRQYAGAFEPWKVKLAVARIRRYRVPWEAWQDTMQELAIVIHKFVFDSERAGTASERTILCRMLDNRIRTLARSNARRLACMDRFGDLRQTEEDPRRPDHDAAESQVQDLVEQLPDDLREVCLGLMKGQTIHAIARRTDRAWGTVQRQVGLIREAFAAKGLDEWFA